MKKDLRFRKGTLLILFFLFLATLWAIFPLLHRGFFVTDDGEWMIIRFSAFYAALRDGQFPVRFPERLNFEYGYPVTTFLYPGFMYFAVPLQILKFGFVTSIKIILSFSFIATTIFVYLWLSKFFARIPSTIGALFSLYIPYHLYDVYTRGSVGEVFALTWVPFILWMIERKNIFFVSIGIFFLLISHNTIALLFLPIIFFYALLRNVISKKKLFISFILGIGMSAFFIIPAVLELQFTRFFQTKISNPLNYFAGLQLIGFSTTIIILTSLIVFLWKKKAIKKMRKIYLLFLLLSFASIFLNTSYSCFIWNIIPSSFIQFPFRLLSYLIISVAFLSAFVFANSKGITKYIVMVVFIGIMIFSAYSYITPHQVIDKGDGYYTTNDATTTVQDEYMPLWVHQKPLKRPEEKIEIIKGQGEIKNILSTNKKIQFTSDGKKDMTVQVNTIYWPGWNAKVDKKVTIILYNNPKGVMQLAIPSGKHQVEIVFEETSLRLASDMISLVSLIALIIISTKYKSFLQ